MKIKRKGRFIRPQRAPGGGYYVHLGSMKKRPVAHLVLEAFLGPRPPKLAARYIDGNPTNPSARNLYWGKRKRRAGLKRRRIASQPMNSPGMPSGL